MATITKKKKSIKKKPVVKKKVVKKAKTSGFKIPYNLSEAWCFKTFSDALKKSDSDRIGEIELASYNADYNDKDISCSLNYTVDDRKESRGTDDTVENKMKKLLGNKFDVSLERKDAYPNGTAFYEVTISMIQ